MNRLLRRFVPVLLIAIALYGAFVVWSGYDDIRESLSAFRPIMLLWALGCATANYALRLVKWEFYLWRLGIRGVGKLDSALVFLSGFAFTLTPGKVGEVFKSAVLLQTHRIPVARTAPIVIAERLTDVIGVVLLIALGSLGFDGGLMWAILGALCVALAIALILWRRPLEALVEVVSRGPERVRRLAPRLKEAVDALRLVAGPASLAVPSVLSLIAWGLEGVALHLVLVGFGAESSLALAVFFYSTATLAGALIPVPGGLGVTESMLQQQIVRLGGVAMGVATSGMLLTRLATLWWAVILGFVALGWLKLRHPCLLAADDGKAAQLST